ncbi:MAG: ATP-grasp domain-containing protein [Lachnospiraceae bacterium]|jgi:hypothetical protein
MKAIGIIHAYPGKEILQALNEYEIHLFVPNGYGIKTDNERNAYIHEVELSETDECVNIIFEVVKTYDIEMFLPLYEGGILLSAMVSTKANLNFYSIPTALASRNKYYLKQVMQLYGVPVPNSVPVYRFTPYSYISNIIGENFILKIVDSMNSQAVMLIKTEEEYNKNVKKLFGYLECEDITQSIDRNRFCYGKDDVKVIAQEYCSGAEVNVDVMICGKEKYTLGIFQKADTKGPFFPETMSYYPSDLAEEVETHIIQNAIKACEALDIRAGVVHVEFRMKDTVPCLLDMGLRPGGAYTVQAIEEITGVNVIKQMTDIFLKGICGKVEKKNDVSIIYGGIVFEESGKINRIEGLEGLEQIEGLRHFKQLANVGDLVVSPPFSAQPHFCYYYISGESIMANKEQHYKLQEMIKINIEKKVVSNNL